MMPGGRMRAIHFGSYWMKENDVVSLMARSLASLCELRAVDTEIYSDRPSVWCESDSSESARFPVRWLDHDRVLKVATEHQPELVVVNSGGMSLRPETLEALREHDVTCVGISLSDPDVFPHHGRRYAHLYDLFYTNSLYSLEHQYPPDRPARLLPFAAAPELHRPMPEVEKDLDLVVVGHARPERKRLLKRLSRRFRVGTFGDGWGPGSSAVHGDEHARAINRGKVYLSFAATEAGHQNVKVGLFEAAACRVLVVTARLEELECYFSYGLEVLAYRSPGELEELLAFYLKHAHLREWIADNAWRRVQQEHTWDQRWNGVLRDVARLRLQLEGGARGGSAEQR